MLLPKIVQIQNGDELLALDVHGHIWVLHGDLEIGEWFPVTRVVQDRKKTAAE